MSKKQRDIELFIVDIFVAIIKIKEYVAPFKDDDEFRYSGLHWDASIRQLEIIEEALNNLLDDEYFSSLSPKYFRKIVNFRNVIIHGYFGIDSEEVWDVITTKLDLLNEDLKDIVKNSTINLTYACETTLNEYKMSNNQEVINFLSMSSK